jgi:hypothetical protein
MIYRDDEDKLLYVTKRVVVQRAEIVYFVCAYLHNVVGQEEPHPIRVADVERMLHAYLLDNSPGVVLLDDVSATKVEVLRRLSVAEPHTGASVISADHVESGARHTVVDPAGEDLLSSNRDVGRDVHEPPEEQEGSRAIVTPAPRLDGHPTGTTSHRFPRAAHESLKHVVNVGRRQDSALYVQLKYDSDLYNYYMPAFECNSSSDYAFLVGDASVCEEELETWKKANLAEIKSIVCDNNVWDVREPPDDANLLTSKWVRTVKSNGIHKSRVCGRGFNMIQGVDYHETFSPVAKLVTFRIFMTLVAIYCLFTGALDIKTAFLNALDI